MAIYFGVKMSPIKMFHNLSYPESRTALAILDDNNIVPTIVCYVENPLSQKKLFNSAEKLDARIRGIIRINEPEYKKLNLDNQPLNQFTLTRIICEHPKLIQRPIVVKNDIAVIGRPIYNLLKLLSH
jgi:arsenate reductase